MSQQKIIEKVLSLLEYLEAKLKPRLLNRMGHKELKTIDTEIRRRLDEISLESFAEINKPEDENLTP